MSRHYLLKISCLDRPGIIAAVTGFIHHTLGGNILDLNHHSEEARGLFFLLCGFVLPEGRSLSGADLEALPAFAALKREYGLAAALHDSRQRPRIALLVTKADHCLLELILKARDGYLQAEIACIASNRPDLEAEARRFDLPFFHCPAENGKEAHESALEEVLARYGVETVVLARYMQVLSASFIGRWLYRVVNVHHGFLPAFKGAKPYHQAWEKGVKIIGATAHYATPDLDEGPIIYQGVAPVENNLGIRAFVERGKDIERKVIVEGLKLHLENRVFVQDGRTIIL